MPRQLNVRSDEAYETAHEIARRLNVTATEVVVRALRELDKETPRPAKRLGASASRRYDRLMALAELGGRLKLPGATSDHSDLYDESGLPI